MRKTHILAFIYLARAAVITVFVLAPLTPMSVYVFASLMGLLWLSTVPATNAAVAQIFGVAHLSCAACGHRHERRAGPPQASSHRNAQHGGCLMSAAPMRRWSARGVVPAVLAGVFMLYLQPEFMVTLAQQVWDCF